MQSVKRLFAGELCIRETAYHRNFFHVVLLDLRINSAFAAFRILHFPLLNAIKFLIITVKIFIIRTFFGFVIWS